MTKKIIFKLKFFLKGLSFAGGFSLCLRVQFKFFNENCIFESEELKFGFRDYKAKVAGTMKIDNRYFVFGWPGGSS